MIFSNALFLQVELTGSSVFDYIHPGDHVEMAEQLGMKLPPGRGMSLSQGAVNEDGASSASSSSHSETPEPGRYTWESGFKLGNFICIFTTDPQAEKRSYKCSNRTILTTAVKYFTIKIKQSIWVLEAWRMKLTTGFAF